VEAAALEYRRALADAGDSVPIMTRLSTLLIDLGRTQEALEILKRARDLSPDHPTVYTRLGQVHIKLKDFKSARENFEASIQINPFDPEVHQGLATASEMLGDSAAAHKEREIVKKMEGLVTRTR
jgi:predicted Zn-dependent protease